MSNFQIPTYDGTHQSGYNGNYEGYDYYEQNAGQQYGYDQNQGGDFSGDFGYSPPPTTFASTGSAYQPAMPSPFNSSAGSQPQTNFFPTQNPSGQQETGQGQSSPFIPAQVDLS